MRARYLQIDSKNKCVPPDWYLGFETFTIYTFFQLAGSRGYLKDFNKVSIVDFCKEFP